MELFGVKEGTKWIVAETMANELVAHFSEIERLRQLEIGASLTIVVPDQSHGTTWSEVLSKGCVYTFIHSGAYQRLDLG